MTIIKLPTNWLSPDFSMKAMQIAFVVFTVPVKPEGGRQMTTLGLSTLGGSPSVSMFLRGKGKNFVAAVQDLSKTHKKISTQMVLDNTKEKSIIDVKNLKKERSE
ncbi:hypothetical protein Btru_068735 [Bulinus truncatus]|nr:hypothetical protein Btru_068735 [Bulinus truncatus]